MNYDPQHLRQAILGSASRPEGGMYTHPFGDPGPMPRECRWPMWGNEERATHVYCGKPNIAGRVYCREHCGIAYTRLDLTNETETRTPGLATSGIGLATRDSTSAQAGAATPVPAVPGAPIRKPRIADNPPAPALFDDTPPRRPYKPLRAKKIKNGAAPFARVHAEIDIRLCVNDTERATIAMWNAGKSQREIAKHLGVTHNVIAGRCARIRKREVEG